MSWTPYPFRGAFSILDETDGATLERVRLVYEFLAGAQVRTTKTVWAFEAEELSGLPPLPAAVLRGVTLENLEYRELCADLARKGFEIALHGASAGNNRRERTAAAFEMLERELGSQSPTFLCHAKNAENIYWQHRAVARGPLRWMMRILAAGHRCAGENPRSPYFWGDLCFERVRYVRLFRTARINTLAANPAMPYFEPAKPRVRGWFSVTDRTLEDCTSPDALAALTHENGLCLTQQRLTRYVRPRRRLDPAFELAIRRLRGAPDLWVDTAGAVLDRLRLIQGVVLAFRDSDLWIVNTNAEPVRRLQLVMGERARPQGRNVEIAYDEGVSVIELLPPRSVTYLDCSAPLSIEDRNAVELDQELHGRWNFGHGTVWINLGHRPWEVAGRSVAPATFEVTFEPGCEEVRAMSRASDGERTRLFLHHAALMVRRIAREGTTLDLERANPRARMEVLPAHE